MPSVVQFAARRAQPSPHRGKTIVIVDDSADLLDVTAMLLEEEGYAVLTALSGEEGLRLALQHQVDLVLLDYAMPRMTGAEVARCLREQDPDGAVKIVMNTATPEWQVQRDFSGYDEFLSKPLRPGELVGTVAALLQN